MTLQQQAAKEAKRLVYDYFNTQVLAVAINKKEFEAAKRCAKVDVRNTMREYRSLVKKELYTSRYDVLRLIPKEIYKLKYTKK